MMNPYADAEYADSNWHSLYKIGGAATLIMVAITLAQFVVFIVAPPPLESTATNWFALFQKSAFFGLLGFESLRVIYALLSVLVSVALCATLRPASQSLTALFLILSVIGAMAFVVARPALEMQFQHLDPAKAKLPLFRLVRELSKFFVAVYPLFQKAAS